MDPDADPRGRRGEALEVVERVKLALSRKTETGTGSPEIERQTIEALHVGETRLSRRDEFPIEDGCVLAGRQEEIPVVSNQIASDPFLRDDRGNSFDCGLVT